MYANRQILQTSGPIMVSQSQTSKPEPTACSGCGAMVEPRWIEAGRRSWWNAAKECPACQAIREARERAAWIRRERRRERRKLVECVRALDIPPKFQYARIGHIAGCLRSFLLGRDSVYLWGGVGTGKTYATMALMREEGIRRRIICRAVFEDLLAELRNFERGGSEDEILTKYLNASTTILDDVGQSSSDFSVRILFRIVDTRLERQRKTVLISNLSPESFREVCGDRLFSRIQTYKIVKLDGPDRRMEK